MVKIEIMASNAEIRINLTALKRQDPYISNIVDSSTQVAIYSFNNQNDKWEKTGVEGSLFVYSRLAPPTHGFTIMNRLSMDNFSQPLTKEIDFHMQDPFLLFRTAKLAIFGIWFYDIHDSHRIGNLFEKLCKDGTSSPVTISSSQNQQKLPLSNHSSSQRPETVAEKELVVHKRAKENGIATQVVKGSQQSFNILDILCKAQVNYEKVHGNTGKGEHESNTKVTGETPKNPAWNVKSDLKKLNVAALFKKAETKNNERTKRTSPAEVLRNPKSESGQNASDLFQSNQERGNTRSLSLSLTDKQLRTHEPRNVVNSAISVVELESPVVNVSPHVQNSTTSKGGMPEKRFFHVPSVEGNVTLDQLLGKAPTVTTPNKSEIGLMVSSSNQLESNSEKSSCVATGAVIKTMNNMPSKAKLQRAMSTPIGLPNVTKLSSTQLSTQSTSGSSLFQSTFPTTSSVPHATMPVSQEDSLPNLLLRSMSIASGLTRTPRLVEHHTTQISAALHGTNTQHDDKPRIPSNSSKVNYTTSSKFVTLHQDAGPLDAALATDPVRIANATPQTSESKTLISPEDFEYSTATPQKAMELRKRLLPLNTALNEPLVLSKKQLAESLITLLQTDTSFLDTVHKAYLDGLTKIRDEQGQYDASNISISMSPLWDS